MGRSAGFRALIGLLAMASIGALAFFGTRFALGTYSEDYRVNVTIGETGQGIISGSDVVARGVIVGEVGAISLNDDLQAVVELVLQARYTIPQDAMFTVTGKTLLGEKQIEILFDGPFDAVASIPNNGVVSDPDQVVELQDVLQELDELFGAIDPVDLAIVVDDGLGSFVGQEDAIGRAVDQGARATDVFSRSLDDQIPGLRDLSLVAETLGPRGDEFNRFGSVIDGGAFETLTANQSRLRGLLDTLNAFSDELDLVLELTRPELDRLIIQGDNVTRLLFTYRPEFADMLVGLSDYTDIIGNGGLSDPGFSGLGAGFQIILDNPFGEFCAEVPPELAPVIPACAGEGAPPPAPPTVPVIPDVLAPAAVLQIPGSPVSAPDLPLRSGLEAVIDGLLDGTIGTRLPLGTTPQEEAQ